jgi:hypothetical protein
MCDYSLEMYKSRAAQAEDKLVTSRFPSGSIGLIEEGGDKSCATCIAKDTVLKLDLSNDAFEPLRNRHELGLTEAVTFLQMDSGVYRDGIRFENGVELSLQQLPAGIPVQVAAIPMITLVYPTEDSILTV